MSLDESVRTFAAFVPQHRQEWPLGVQLGRIAEVSHHCAGDAVNSHPCPTSSFAVSGIEDLPQQGDHPKLFEQRGVERYFIDAVDDVRRRARRSWPLHRIDLNKDGVLRGTFAHQWCDRGIACKPSIPISLPVNLDRLKQSREEPVYGKRAHAPSARLWR